MATDSEKCPLCEGHTWGEGFLAGAWTVARCAGCGLQKTLAVPADEGVTQYPVFDQRDTAPVRWLRTAVAQLLRERQRLVTRLQPGGRLLDVGCGNGGFARRMAAAGYDVVGIEPYSLGREVNEGRLRLIRGRIGEPTEGSADPLADLGDFDVITLWQVLEHIAEPLPLLRRLLSRLRPGGTLVISVPNFASWQRRVFGPRWFHLDPPRHILHFDRKTLDRLVAQLGLQVVGEQTFHLEYGPVGWLQSALNSLLPRPNFLYELVKDRGALAQVPATQQALYLAASLFIGGSIAPACVLLEGLAGRHQAGAAITLSLRKNEPSPEPGDLKTDRPPLAGDLKTDRPPLAGDFEGGGIASKSAHPTGCFAAAPQPLRGRGPTPPVGSGTLPSRDV